jgi:hypothetical protein
MWRRDATAAYAVGLSLLFITALLRDSKHVVYLDGLSNDLLHSERIRKHTEHPSTRHLKELVLDYRGCVQVQLLVLIFGTLEIPHVLCKLEHVL